MKKKLLDFQSSISEVKQINPLFSTCRVRIMYTGKNRNMSVITKDAVEKALPSLIGVPIVGEFSEENQDYKGHGGKIDLDSYKYIHTTKPYGFVPESATYEWEAVQGSDGTTRDYLVVNGCLLWTGRYEEAYSIIANGKGQSMEIEVTDGIWNEEQEAYQVNNFLFSALCVLGDDVEPAFEKANITAYSLDRESFKQEFTQMLSDFKSTLSEKDKEVKAMLEKLLAKYSITLEDLEAKGIAHAELGEAELEAEIKANFAEGAEAEVVVEESKEEAVAEEVKDADAEVSEESREITSDESDKAEVVVEETAVEAEVVEQEAVQVEAEAEEAVEVQEEVVEEVVVEEAPVVNEELESLKVEFAALKEEVEGLRAYKLAKEAKEHEGKVEALFANFKLTKEDVEGLDIHKFSLEEVEEKCYAILGRKMATKKEFSKSQDKGNIRLPITSEENQEQPSSRYDELFDKYK